MGHFTANNLVNNADKAALLYNNKRKADDITLEVAGESISAKTEEKLLGLQISSSMNWKAHIELLKKKMSQKLGILRRLKSKIPGSKLEIVAQAFFTSVARYGIAVYFKPRLYNDPMCGEQDKLQVIQNKMFRLLTGTKIEDKVRVEKLAKDLNQMSMNQMSCYHILVETYNIINFETSMKIRNKLLPNNPHSTRLTVPLFKKDSCRSFSYYAAKLWNLLPLEIRSNGMPKSGLDKRAEDSRLNSFKTEIKKWILGTDESPPGVPFR